MAAERPSGQPSFLPVWRPVRSRLSLETGETSSCGALLALTVLKKLCSFYESYGHIREGAAPCAPAIELPCLTQVPHREGQVERLQAGLRCGSAASSGRDCPAYRSLCTRPVLAGLCLVTPVAHNKRPTCRAERSEPELHYTGTKTVQLMKLFASADLSVQPGSTCCFCSKAQSAHFSCTANVACESSSGSGLR